MPWVWVVVETHTHRFTFTVMVSLILPMVNSNKPWLNYRVCGWWEIYGENYLYLGQARKASGHFGFSCVWKRGPPKFPWFIKCIKDCNTRSVSACIGHFQIQALATWTPTQGLIPWNHENGNLRRCKRGASRSFATYTARDIRNRRIATQF